MGEVEGAACPRPALAARLPEGPDPVADVVRIGGNVFTDEELQARVSLFLPLIDSAPWQRELALTVLREVQADALRCAKSALAQGLPEFSERRSA